MSSRFKTFTLKFLIALNFILAVIYLLACLAPYLNPAKWWIISLLDIFFPFILILLFTSVIFWLFIKPRNALLFFVILLAGFKNIGVFFAFNIPKKFDTEKQASVLRIVSWNVARFVEITKNNNKGSQIRLKMMEQLKDQNADILCLQEFHTSAKPNFYDNISYIQKELDYPYFYFSYDEDGDKLYYSSIIFSRLPIIDSSIILYPRPTLPEALLQADVKFHNDTIRIMTTHLQSVQLKKADYEKINKIESYQDSMLANSKTIFSKLKRGVINRSIQADIVHERITQSPYPVILCADFNDVPYSYTYFTIKGDLQDAFLQKGFGIGRTFSSLSPTLRIDYILTSKKISIVQFNRTVKEYSDHYMIVADVKPKTPQQ